MEELEPKNNLNGKALYDYRLVRLAVDHADQKAYAELMHRYKESVYFIMLRMVNNKDDANDLTIEGFAKAFKSLPNYAPTFGFSTWLFRVASNNAIDFVMRRRKKNAALSLDSTIENEEGQTLSQNIKSQTLDPEEDFIKKEKFKYINEVVDKLKPHYRDIVRMRYYDELSIEEIAAKYELPSGTIKAQLFRARELLYQVLKNKEGKM